MLNAEVLEADLKSDFISFMEKCWSGENGMTIEKYADELAKIISSRVITHIKNNAQVSTTITGAAAGPGGSYPVTGTGTGGIS
jgi:hypothetical protein